MLQAPDQYKLLSFTTKFIFKLTDKGSY